MSAQFKVGDICIGQNFVVDTERNGMECTIIGSLATYQLILYNNELLYGYECEGEDGLQFVCAPHNLRLKHPPRSAKSIMREVIAKAKKPLEVPEHA